MVQAANVTQMLQNSGNLFTVFAPVNSAIQVAVEHDLIMCQAEDYLDQPCTSLQALFNSTSLPQLVLNNSKLQKLYTTSKGQIYTIGHALSNSDTIARSHCHQALLPARDVILVCLAVVQGQWASTNLTNGMSLQTLGGAVLQVSTVTVTAKLQCVQ